MNERLPAVVPDVDWEVILSGNHPDICVTVSLPATATEEEILEKACVEAMAKTYVWSKKRLTS